MTLIPETCVDSEFCTTHPWLDVVMKHNNPCYSLGEIPQSLINLKGIKTKFPLSSSSRQLQRGREAVRFDITIKVCILILLVGTNQLTKGTGLHFWGDWSSSALFAI